jgi:DNA-binding XRE family transcriptional regulator
MRVTSVSVPDIGRSLRLARERAGLSHEEVAERTGLATTELEALESGTVGRMADRVETLRSMRTYALSLGLPGNEYVLATLELWPSVDDTSARGADSGQVPAVSVSSAPAGPTASSAVRLPRGCPRRPVTPGP